jgi:hypothetical protein
MFFYVSILIIISLYEMKHNLPIWCILYLVSKIWNCVWTKPQKTTNIWILTPNIIKEINLKNIAQMQPHLILWMFLKQYFDPPVWYSNKYAMCKFKKKGLLHKKQTCHILMTEIGTKPWMFIETQWILQNTM